MMALEKENHEIADTIQSFSRLLRNTISSKESMITIKSETENAANYIKLAQMQYKNKLAFTMEVDKSISECMVTA